MENKFGKILITGGAGFIGSAYVWYLNTTRDTLIPRVDNIVICDTFGKEEKWLNLRQLKYRDVIFPEDIYTQIGNYLETETCSEKLEDITAVIHLGACSSTTEKDMDFLYYNNVEFSKQLFYFCAKKNIPFLYASSAATYGDGSLGYNSSNYENLLPLNKYGYSKQFFDLWVKKELENRKEKKQAVPRFTIAFKFFNVFGPNEYHKNKMASVVFHAFHQIKKEGKIKLFKSYRNDIENGEQKRDFIYVKEACAQMTKVWTDTKNWEEKKLSLPPVKGELDPTKLLIQNIGMGKAHSFNELAKGVFKALGKEPDIEYIEMPIEIRDKYQYFTQAERIDSNQQNEILSFSDAIKDYVQNYLDTETPHFKSF